MSSPTILWIVTTQWRAQATGYAGDPNARTPVLDRLAAQSVNFAQAVTPHPFGPFARAAMLTGVPSPENGIKDYYDPLPVGARTIAHDLAERGYTTAFFGKWHLASRDPKAPLVGETHARMKVPAENRGGFALWEGFESGFLLNDPWLHGSRLPEPVQFRGYQSDVICARAADVLRTRTAQPKFMVVSLEAPHPPYDAPLPSGIKAWNPSEIVLPVNVPSGGDVEVKARKELAGYYAHIEATDRAIGALLEAVREEAMVVFTSVHGDMHGAHGLFRKGWPHEESVRVPLLVRPAAAAAAAGAAAISNFRSQISDRAGATGSVSNEAVSLVDLRRLTLGWAANGPSSLRNSKPETQNPKLVPRTAARISMPSVVALPHQCDRVWRGIRSKSLKLVLNDDGSPWLFFDLERDPLELRNLVGDPARREEIIELTALCRQGG